MLDKKLSDKTSEDRNGKSNGKGNLAPKNVTANANTGGNRLRNANVIKSPSDTTLYTPGLMKACGNTRQDHDINAIEKISNFVESIRLDGALTGNRRDTTSLTKSDVRSEGRGNNSAATRIENTPESSRRRSIHDAHQNERSEQQIKDPEKESEEETNRLLLQAEKFRARVEAPRGMVNNVNSVSSMLMPYDYERVKSKFVTDDGLAPIDSEILFLRNFDQDDEFFHVTSQIDSNLKAKIERGEFVDLERLLPKDKLSSVRAGSDDLNKQLFQLISQGTNTYLNPSDTRSGNRINNLKKWDQAFRVYAAIYTQANPGRSSEIWQYVYIIHTAATGNLWDNVSYYDIIFRELMASKPWRSWGKTYTQGWNMAFNNGGSFGHSHTGGHTGTYTNQEGSSSQGKSWKDDCCWRFNKNKCKRTANECRYDHRCTHCAGWYHSYNNCRKRNNRGNGNNNPKANNWTTYNRNTKVSPARQNGDNNTNNQNTNNKAQKLGN